MKREEIIKKLRDIRLIPTLTFILNPGIQASPLLHLEKAKGIMNLNTPCTIIFPRNSISCPMAGSVIYLL